ncbi:MAG: ATP-dependent helicase [Chloroflexi bacterium]|nr:ATP-dependent helicase [Chloroflexota bacterium]
MPEPSIHTDDLGEVLDRCLSLDDPKSFFLFAGAGSGKTRALVQAMTVFRKKHGKEFRLSGRQVAVITYTNAACDEIKSRTAYDSVFAVSTIHSFAWELIRAYHQDIREWLGERLRAEIADLQAQQAKGRAGTKAASDRAAQIEAKTKRLGRLGSIKAFAYNPNGENIGKNSLNHAEVIGLAADFLTSKPLMQRILVRKYPIVLIDESQDTQKDLVDAQVHPLLQAPAHGVDVAADDDAVLDELVVATVEDRLQNALALSSGGLLVEFAFVAAEAQLL